METWSREDSGKGEVSVTSELQRGYSSSEYLSTYLPIYLPAWLNFRGRERETERVGKRDAEIDRSRKRPMALASAPSLSRIQISLFRACFKVPERDL